ncbi:DNA-binding transcriptional LysR family regulator [Clostridium pascui]|uniref:LysR family transcriptional regulator n=1 Tax=Clostridium pascui TaxID=46609 RepID=UPI001955FB4B|nr:LysR family transcriptional regulator [Clostridium pascui]MBM7868564.1 DNA-binding transcriptional LysR family regulator [Clostridium pascui]
MTLQQLRYAIEVAEKGSISEAAKSLFITQPSLSNAIKELETEIKTTIFTRTNKGVLISKEGGEFLGYARQVLQQTDLLESKYLNERTVKQKFSVSTQHYTFAANAFVELVREFGAEEYEFTINETKTWEIIEDVKNLHSEIGIIYLSNYNEAVLRKIFEENNLIFTELFVAEPHVFLYNRHPLAGKKSIEIEELDEYPCLSFSQGQYNSFYFTEEILSTRIVKKSIKVSDRAAIVNFMIGLNGYTISTGVFPKYLHGDDIISVPLEVEEKIQVGTIVHKDMILSSLGEII